jgi:hypothetical protein
MNSFERFAELEVNSVSAGLRLDAAATPCRAGPCAHRRGDLQEFLNQRPDDDGVERVGTPLPLKAVTALES